MDDCIHEGTQGQRPDRIMPHPGSGMEPEHKQGAMWEEREGGDDSQEAKILSIVSMGQQVEGQPAETALTFWSSRQLGCRMGPQESSNLTFPLSKRPWGATSCLPASSPPPQRLGSKHYQAHLPILASVQGTGAKEGQTEACLSPVLSPRAEGNQDGEVENSDRVSPGYGSTPQ